MEQIIKLEEKIAKLEKELDFYKKKSLEKSSNNLDESISNQIIDNVDKGIFLINDRVFSFVNNYLTNLLEYEKDELIGLDFINIVDENSHKTVQKYYENKIESKNTQQQYRLRLITKTKHIVNVLIYIKFIDINNKTYLLGILQNISKELELQKILVNQNKEIKQSAEFRSNFIINMSHEIRTPLNSIIGFTDLLTQDDVPQNKKESYVKIIKKSGLSLLNLVNDIIDLSKIDTNNITIKNKEIDIIELLKNIFNIFKNNTILSRNIDITPKLVLPNDIKSHKIFTDKYRIEQIINNLLDNAIKYSKKGNIILGIKILNEKTIIYVKDTGIGISKENQKNIFNRFERISYSNNQKGVGIGLTISKKLAKLLNGDLLVESKYSEGSTFFLTLPNNTVGNTSNNTVLKTLYSKDYSFNKKTILIAEDEETNFILLKEILSKTKANVLWAKNGKQAIKYMQSETNIDIVLMDLKMPIMSGLDATKEIRKFDKITPIIAQTALAISDEKTLSLNAGCNDFILKPIKKVVLLDKINRQLSKKNS